MDSAVSAAAAELLTMAQIALPKHMRQQASILQIRYEQSSIYNIIWLTKEQPSPSPSILSELNLMQHDSSEASSELLIRPANYEDLLQLRQNTRKLQESSSGPHPKNVDAAWEVYNRLREDSHRLCKNLLQTSCMADFLMLCILVGSTLYQGL